VKLLLIDLQTHSFALSCLFLLFFSAVPALWHWPCHCQHRISFQGCLPSASWLRHCLLQPLDCAAMRKGHVWRPCPSPCSCKCALCQLPTEYVHGRYIGGGGSCRSARQSAVHIRTGLQGDARMGHNQHCSSKVVSGRCTLLWLSGMCCYPMA
jgi:hypothetical protein